MRDLELALDVAVQLPGAPRTGRRAGPSHGRASGDAPAGSGSVPASPAENGSAGHATDPDAASDPAGTSAWLSHPSFPPGVIEPPSAPVVPPDVAAQEIGADEVEASYEQEHAFAPGEDEHGYAAAEAGWDDEQAYGEAYEEEGVTSAAEAPAPARRRRRWLVVAIAAVAVAALAIGAAVVLLPSRTSAEPFRSYSNTGSSVPYTLSRPQSWTAKEGTASDTVLSSRPDAVGDTFFLGAAGSTQRWDGTRHLLASSPKDAVGMYVYASDATSDTTTDALQSAIAVNAAGPISWDPAHWQRKIAGSPADELEGVMVNPADPTVRLQVDFYVVRPANGGTLLLAFFAPPGQLEAQQPTIDRVLASLRLT